MSQVITGSSIKTIEDLFRQYPDTPREVIIKQDVMRLGEKFSDSALAAAAGAQKKSYQLFSGDLIPMSAMPRQEYLKAPDHFFIKGGPYSLRPVGVYTSMAADSPYLIDVVDGRLQLLLDGVAVADVGYRPHSKYDSTSFPDGTPYRHVMTYEGTIIPFSLCQFWGAGEECKFCDINENARQSKKFKADTLTAPVLKVAQVAEVANEITKEVLEREGYQAPIWFMINGGTITSQLHGLKEDEFYLRYVEAIKGGGPRRQVNLDTNAKDKATLREYHHRGLDRYFSNIEVWDKRLFEWICPGKDKRVGREEWAKRLVEAVDVFGEGKVSTNFVGGLELAQPHGFKTIAEAVKSTTEGFKFLMSHGVWPRFGFWRRESASELQKKYDQPAVPAEYYLQLVRNHYENWKRYEMPLPPYRITAGPETRVIGTGHCIYEDYVLITELKDYENRALQSLEKAGTIWS